MTNDELIEKAESVLNPHKTKDGRLHGDVGAAVLGKNGKVYTGVCIDTTSTVLCAERNAIASMITEKEYGIDTIVAVWRDDKTGKLHALPPCGVCREFMRQVDESNLESEIILRRNETAKLKNLLPKYEWPDPLD